MTNVIPSNTWQPNTTLKKFRTSGETGALADMMTLNLPPKSFPTLLNTNVSQKVCDELPVLFNDSSLALKPE
jgi:hypothetical protein